MRMLQDMRLAVEDEQTEDLPHRCQSVDEGDELVARTRCQGVTLIDEGPEHLTTEHITGIEQQAIEDHTGP